MTQPAQSGQFTAIWLDLCFEGIRTHECRELTMVLIRTHSHWSWPKAANATHKATDITCDGVPCEGEEGGQRGVWPEVRCHKVRLHVRRFEVNLPIHFLIVSQPKSALPDHMGGRLLVSHGLSMSSKSVAQRTLVNTVAVQRQWNCTSSRRNAVTRQKKSVNCRNPRIFAPLATTRLE